MNAIRLGVMGLWVVFLWWSPVSRAGEYLLKVKAPVAAHRLSAMAVHQVEFHEPGSWARVQIDERKLRQVLVELSELPEFDYLVPNLRVETPRPNLEIVGGREQWGLRRVQAHEAWLKAREFVTHEVVVAVIDTGADYRHISLAPNMVPGFNFIKNNTDPMDEIAYGFPGHGTHCTGVVGATGDPRLGISGVGPRVKLMPLKFMDDNGGLISDAIKAIDFAVANGARVISASWGVKMSEAGARPLVEAIARAEAKSVVFVTAAGNNGHNNDEVSYFPANAPLSNVIVVAATDQSDQKPKWSNFGVQRVHVSAPGVSILSTLPGNRAGSMSGTSMAAPHVAGLVGLLLSLDGSLSPLDVREMIQETGDQVSVDVNCRCRINALKSVERVLMRRGRILGEAQQQP